MSHKTTAGFNVVMDLAPGLNALMLFFTNVREMKAFVEKAIRNYNVGLIALPSIEAHDLYFSGSAVSELATRWRPDTLYNMCMPI